MENKLRELIGQPNVWLFVKSSNGWLKNVEILDVSQETVTFRYENESDKERKLWEKTTRIKNVTEIEVCLLAIPKRDGEVQEMKNRLSQIFEKE
ncbi:hypothetical protein NIES4075_04110 [Tolypothrix sp. NIES-4075]|uniref:DUF6679 family protein n=1 Tax=Tolypothrix sp. NIES-4075 TaxID=2005459 RepID=UPI000B5CAADE|nr:DUF6679 family protein [Tolypothrix sp. NIES-4075]GAX39455.1 hypothetical protein NIES4075_04110 [Tolypothrix sp. NIES-4075]